MGLASPAEAQNRCVLERSGLPANFAHFVDSFPGADSTMVPLDGFVRIRYHGRVPEGALFVEEVTPSGSTIALTGQVNTVAAATPVDFAEIHFRTANFRPLTRYQVTFPDITGGAASNRFTFTTGSLDGGQTTPGFEGLVGEPVVAMNGDGDLCGDSEAMTVSLHWIHASSAWPINDIEYIVYQTRGAGIGGPVERMRQRGRLVSDPCPASLGNTGSDSQCVSFRLSSDNASEPMCFNVQAVDAYGRADGNAEEKCVDPDPGAAFVGCTAAPRSQHRPLGWLLLTASATVAAVGVSRIVSRRKRR